MNILGACTVSSWNGVNFLHTSPKQAEVWICDNISISSSLFTLSPYSNPFPRSCTSWSCTSCPSYLRAYLLFSISEEVDEHINSFVAPFSKQWGGMCGHMECCAVLTDWCESCSRKPIPLVKKKGKRKEFSKPASRILQMTETQHKWHYFTYDVCKHKDSYLSMRNPLSVSAPVAQRDFSCGEHSLRFCWKIGTLNHKKPRLFQETLPHMA